MRYYIYWLERSTTEADVTRHTQSSNLSDSDL